MSADGSKTNSPASGPAKPSRNPIERAIVWGLILCLLGLVGYEFKQQKAYNASLKTVTEKLKDDERQHSAVGELRQALSGSPIETSPETKSRLNRVIEWRWHSFFKDYRIRIVAEKGDDGIVFAFSTPTAKEEADEAPVTASTSSPTPSAPGGMMGGMMGGHNAMAGAGAPGGGGPGGGGPGGGGPGGGGGRGRGLIGMAMREEVVAELKLTDEQKGKLNDAQSQMREQFGKLRDLPETERPAAMIKLRDQTEVTVKGILEEGQFGRLMQLTWREAGLSSVERDDVSKLLEISDEQREKINPILAARREAMRSLGMAPPDVAAAKAAEFNDQLKGTLTAEQLKKFEDALGAPAPQPAKNPEAAAALVGSQPPPRPDQQPAAKTE